MVASTRNRNIALGAGSAAFFFVLGAIQRVRRRGRGDHGESFHGMQGRLVCKEGVPADQRREPCPVLWEQIQQRDWLFGLPPQIADSILARLDVQDFKALRLACRQTYLQIAARTTKLVRALDASHRTWRLLAFPGLARIYPAARELHLVLAFLEEGYEEPDCAGGVGGGRDAGFRDPGDEEEDRGGGGGDRLPHNQKNHGVELAGGGSGSRSGSRSPASRAAAAPRRLGREVAAASAGAGRPGRSVQRPGGGGAGSSGSSAAAMAAAVAAACAPPPRRLDTLDVALRRFAGWAASGHLAGLSLLDLSRCEVVPISRNTWANLVGALGPGEVTIRVPWKALMHHGIAPVAAAAATSGSGGSGRASSRGAGGGGSIAAAAKAKAAAAAAAAGLLTPPMSPGGGDEASASPPLLPVAAAERCSCSICGPAPVADASPVVCALQVLAKLRPCCSVELAGRGLPVRSPGLLQQLCGVSQLASVSLAVCGVALSPLAHHAGCFSGLRRLQSLELRYREEPAGGADAVASAALHHILRALPAPVSLRCLSLDRPVSQPLDEADLAALAQLPSLASLDAPGLRVHAPTPLTLSGLTRLALHSDRLELTQPLVALFPALEHLELGHSAADLPPTAVLAAAAAVTTVAAATAAWGGGGEGFLRLPQAAAAPVVEEVAPHGGGGPELEEELVVVPAVAAVGGMRAQPQPQHPNQMLSPHQAAARSLLPQELTLHLRLLQGLSGLRVLSIGGKPGHGVEALSSLTALSSLILVRCSEFRPLRKAVEELRGLTQLRSLELHACLGGDGCGYEIARLLRRLQKLPNLGRLVVAGCDPRLPQQLATAPLARLGELVLRGQPELQPLDLRYAVGAQSGCRRLVVRGCGRLGRRFVAEELPGLVAPNRPALAVEWAP